MKKGLKKVIAVASAVTMLGGAVGALAGCNKIDPSLKGKYTYNTATSSLTKAWNTHTYQSNSATDILDYTEDGFYTFDYNADETSYEIVPAMATKMPQDVSASYVGNDWNIASGETWRAVRVELREDLKYDNGDPIKAGDFVTSIKWLLNPEASNYRADGLYDGQMVITNAEEYLKQGGYNYKAIVSAEFGDDEYIDPASFTTTDDDAATYQYQGKDVVINLESGGNWGSNGLLAYGFSEEDITGWDAFAAKANKAGYIKLDEAGLTIVQTAIAMLHGYATLQAYVDACAASNNTKGGVNYAYVEWEEMCFFGYDWAELDFDKVGVKAVDDYTLDFILAKPLSGFYLNYNLTSSMYLVHNKTYENCISNSAGAYTNNYGTSKDTYVGYGPYRITSYVADSIVTFEKNPYWYGYNDEDNADRYQTTNITIRQVTDAGTRLNMFETGQTDAYGLLAADMAKFQSSDYVYYTEGYSTWFVTFNPDMDGLEDAQEQATPSANGKVVNKTVMALKEFRKAMSFSIDRVEYEATLDPTGSVAKAIYANTVIYDPEKAIAYRDTDEAKQVIVDFWGLADSYGPGKEYETIDDAIASITGYDLAGAKESFRNAYNEAVEQNLIDPNTDWEVQIIIGQPGEGGFAYYDDGYRLLQRVWTEAVKDTPFEGRLVITQSQPLGSDNFAEYLRNNSVDVLFGVGWTGSALDPFNIAQVYVNPDYQYDPGWDSTKAAVDVTVKRSLVGLDGDGDVTLRQSAFAWGSYCLQGTTIPANIVVDGTVTGDVVAVNAGAGADYELRLKILAAVENIVLQQYDMIPVGTQSQAALKGMKINYYKDEYIYGVGRGGIKYMTYNYDDYGWEEFVKGKPNKGTLNYQ